MLTFEGTMKSLIFASLLAATAAFGKPAQEFPDLSSGRYAIKLSGMLCNSCARVIALELSQLKEVESAKADFEKEELSLNIRAGRTLKMSRLQQTLLRAARRINLDTRFQIENVLYKP